MAGLYDLLVNNPLIPLLIAFAGMVISILGVLYNKKANDVARQQLELEKEKFLAEIAKQGPIIQIAKSNVVYSLDTSSKPENTDILRGKLKGRRHRGLLGSHRVTLAKENILVRLKEMFLDISVTVSNVSDVPIQVEKVVIYQRLRPKIHKYLQLFWFLIFDRDLFRDNYCELAIENDEYEHMAFEIGGVVALDWRWVAFCKDFNQMSLDKDFNNCKIEFLDEQTSQRLSKGPFILQPKSRTHWKIRFWFSKRMAQKIYSSGYGPKDITVVLSWGGEMIAKHKALDHRYSLDNGEVDSRFQSLEFIEIENPKYY